MAPILKLEYVCTHAEMDQAQSLNDRKQLGGGSKWRTRVVFFAVLVGMLLGAWFRFREIPEGYRALMLAAIVGGSLLFVFWKRRYRKTDSQTTQLEVSERDITILSGDSKIVLPWSAFRDCLESPDLFVLLDRPRRTLLVVPKRVFPSENWQTWFREQATCAMDHKIPEQSELPVAAPSTSTNRITLTVHPKYRDYLASSIASWRTWGMCFFIGCVLLGVSLFSIANPPPNAVFSDTEVVIFFMMPFYSICILIIVMLSSIRSWRFHVNYVGPQTITLSEQSVAYSGMDSSGIWPWTSFKYYKETPWLFILWRGSHWIMMPKRSFTSTDELSWCRELLDQHTEQSRWFLG